MPTITIPKNLARESNLVAIPHREYKEFLRLKERLLWEEKDTDEAIKIFKQERRAGKLKVAENFASILRDAK